MTESIYRRLLWIYIALLVAGITAFGFADYSEALSAAYDNEPRTWLMSYRGMSLALMAVWATAALVGLFGLFRFRSWGRTLSLVVTLAGLLLSAFMGVFLASGIESALFDGTNMVWGAILALSYFSAVSTRFER